MRLAEVAETRNNNFNLIRMAAALSVLVSHAYPLTGRNADEPATKWLGMSMGDIAVDVFFFISGLLVTGSLLKRRSGKAFVRARFLRIYPGLWAMLILLVFGLGATVSALAWDDYLSSGETWKYLWRNATLVTGMKFNLPGVFIDNPYSRSVNGSLWTMRHEVHFYLVIVLAWGLLRLRLRERESWFRSLVVVTAVGVVAARIALELMGTIGEWQFIKLGAFFFGGAACYVCRDRIQLGARAALLLLTVLVAASWAGNRAFAVAYDLCLGWLLLHAAYLTTPWWLRYNRWGDCSYGVYIYAFPVEQTVAHFMPTFGPIALACVSIPVTVALAALSWTWIEQPAMNRAWARRRPDGKPALVAPGEVRVI